MTVTALLVSHDGARWLPAVLDGLAAQTRPPDRVVAVDTGSRDTSAALLRERLGADAVLSLPADTGYGAAVAAGLRAAGAGAEPPAGQQDGEQEWVWLLHDDGAPTPGTLQTLLGAAGDDPSVSVLGPKLREWPSLRRLLEVGVTISGTGRRETGLERGEYDQGQHDRARDVLAVNTAGMLVRRTLLDELDGFDPQLPVFGTDIDFGWRAARAGHRTLVVPDAVMFHVEAAHRGVRRTAVTTASFRRAQRRAALYILLVNGSLLGLPFQVVRLLLGSLVRALGFLVVRAPREAWDEVAAVAATYLRPDRIASGRARRRRTARTGPRAVRPLLAAPWVPYRHGLDFLTDVASAAAQQAGDVSARRARGPEATETGPVPAEAQNLPADTGLLSRLLTSPTAAVFAVLTVASVVALRGLVGSGMLSGGALLPAPDGALDWWRLYLRSWHDVGVGSSAPAAPYVLPLAVAGSLLLGKAWLLIDLLFLFVVPLAAWGAYRFLRALTPSRPANLWAAAAYGLLPVLSGAVQQGRLGTVVAAAVLPWLAHSALFLGPDVSTDRRWWAAWRTSLWLALLAAFTPLAWPLAALVALVALLAGAVTDRARWARASVAGPVLLSLGAALVLLLPWSLATWAYHGAGSWLFEAGAPAPGLTTVPGRWDVVLGRPGDTGSAPGWLSAGVVLAGLAALVRPDTRIRVLRPWLVLLLSLAVTAALAGRSFSAHGGPGQPVWLGLPLLVTQSAAICAAAVAASGISTRLAGRSFGWRQPVGLLVVAAAVLSPVLGLFWWLGTGDQGTLDRRPVSTVPTYMSDAAEADPDHGVLVVEGSGRDGFEYAVLRGQGRRLGDDSVRPAAEAERPVTRLVGDLATAPEPADVAALARHGVQFIYTPAPADPRLVGNLDSVSGLSSASAVRPGARAWQLEATATGAALPAPSARSRPWLLAGQLSALLAAAVLAAPTRRIHR